MPFAGTSFRRAWFATLTIATLAATADAQIYTVTNTNDAGAGSLRAVITAMNAAGISPSQINFAAGSLGVINLASPLPDIQVSARINPLAASGVVLDGTSAGATHGLRFRENTNQFGSVRGLIIRNFQNSGIVVNPLNAGERVDVVSCVTMNCDGDGIEIAGGANHQIVACFSDSNSGWGVRVSNAAVSNAPVNNCVIQQNTKGGVQLVGSGHTVGNCYVVLNGSAESSDHRGGVVFGSPAASATGCTVELCTLAGNAPYGVKRTSGSVGVIHANETYLNDVAGIRILGTAPTASLGHFVVDSVHNQIITRGTATGPSSANLDLEFFVALETGSDEGSAYLGSADTTVATDGSGNASFFHKFSRSATFVGEAVQPSPVNFTIGNSNRLTATATSSTQGTSEFAAVGEATLPGDFNLDGAVDGADLLIWQLGLGSPREYWQGDADFDGDVDSADKTIWQNNFGKTP